jgi:hypothetical protein
MARNLRSGLRQSLNAGLAGGFASNDIFTTASLDLNFAKYKNIGSLIDFTRASSGTYVGIDGLIKTATTNYLLWSERFNDASWTVSGGVAITPNAIESPFGTLTADLVNFGAPDRVLQQNITGISGVSYTGSIWVKGTAGEAIRLGGANITGASNKTLTGGWDRLSFTGTSSSTSLSLVLSTFAGTTARNIYVWGAQLEQSSTVGEYIKTTSTINSAPRFDHDPTTGESLGLLVEEQRSNLLLNSGTLSTQSVTVTAVAHALSFTGTGTVTLSGASTAGPLVGTGTGEANRVSLTFTPTAGSLTLTVSGTVTNAQLEAGSFPTSYIPTTSSTVTRAADVASISGSNYSGWFNASEGTLFADSSRTSAVPASDFPQVFYLNDGTASNSINIGYITSTVSQFRVRTAGNNEANPTPFITALLRKTAGAYKLNDVAVSTNGSSVLVDTSVILPTTLNSAALGSAQSGASSFLNGTIRRLAYWPQRLGNEVLQTITQ